MATIWRDGGHVLAVDQGEVMRDDPDDPMRTAIRQMAGVLAQLDRRLIIKRLRDGRRATAAQGGKAVGRSPFGWSEDGEVPRERCVLVAVRDLRADGLRRQDVADRLDAVGAAYRPRNTDAWTAAGLAEVGRRAGIG